MDMIETRNEFTLTWHVIYNQSDIVQWWDRMISLSLGRLDIHTGKSKSCPLPYLIKIKPYDYNSKYERNCNNTVFRR